ncbi:hypothetical protein FHX81_3928 [Saccharothrix saharensis]|uniref:Peptidase inhibitor family I36 n=2 Tax=Saccharothrix saharensis TaxID=571190 RepID=A0A543JFM0_9PSEU|nr:hypothetical protein FHX81_3928 [Saccharothrix saharensis]
MRRIFEGFASLIAGIGVLLALSALVAPAAMANPRTCDPGEVCLWTADLGGIYSTPIDEADYSVRYFVDVGNTSHYKYIKLNDKVRKAYNNGCSAPECGAYIVAFFRDSFGGGGRVSTIVPGQEAWMTTNTDAGASSHYWVWA